MSIISFSIAQDITDWSMVFLQVCVIDFHHDLTELLHGTGMEGGGG